MAFKVNDVEITSILNAGFKTGRDSENLIDFATTDNKLIFRVNNVNEVELVENALQPTTNDGVALGTTSLGWSDLHLASAGVINWVNGEMTITETDANTLTVAGGTFATAALTATTITASDDVTIADGKGLTVGHSAQVAVAVGTSELQVLGTDQGESSLTLANWNATAGNMSHMNFLRGGGSSLAGSTIAPADAKLGSITWNTSDGSDYLSISAQIVAIADGTPAGNDTPGLLSFLTTVAGATGATERMRIGSAGSVYIGDTANGSMTQGLTINQGAADNEILALKSSDVAHGVTVFAETDTYGRHRKYDGATGGYGVSGFTEGAIGLDLMAVVTSENSTKSASGTGAIQIDGRLKASTSAGAMSANANILTVGSNGAIKFIVDVDGDTWQNGGATFGDDITLAADKSLNLPQGANVKFTDPITQDSIDDHDAQGIIMTFTAGMTVTPFSPVYLHTDDEVHECDADAIATMPCIGVSVNTSNVADGAAIEVMLLGLIRDESFTDFGTNGAPVYVSTTVGEMTNTAPSGSSDVVQVIGHSIGEKLLFVQPSLTTVEIA